MIIVFDFDGTLIDTNATKHKIIKSFLTKNFGMEAYLAHYDIQKSRIQLLNVLEPENTSNRKKLLEQLSFELDQAVIDCPLYKDTENVLMALKHVGIRLFVSSNTPKNSLNRILTAKDLNQYFEECFGSPNLKTETIKKIREENPDERIIVVGDGEDDLQSALLAKAEFVAVNSARTNVNMYPPITISELIEVINNA